MTAGETSPVREPDPITVEVMRSRLTAIGYEAGIAIERTAMCPVVSETKDWAVSVFDPDGNLIVGTGYITIHFGCSTNAVRSTLKRHAGTIRPGDVFVANDPHTDGGLHPQDVVVQRPAFVGDRLVGWVAVSAHMMDMGGMALGSFAPHATECYQEALRFPSVRLMRAGEEVVDSWAMIATNVRMPALIEADLRALVVGCNVAVAKIEAVVAEMGCETFGLATDALARATEQALRQRVSRIADGVYRATGWIEITEHEAHPVPCALTVAGSRLCFDFAGCPPEMPRYVNSRPYIVRAALAASISSWLSADLPFSQPLLDLLEIDIPPRTMLNSSPPSPLGGAEVGPAQLAAMQCLELALAASPDAPERRLLSAPTTTGYAMMTWSFEGAQGEADTYLHTDGCFAGSPAGSDRDGVDYSPALVGTAAIFELSDVEILESNYPILIEERTTSTGDHGAGLHRSGGACREILRPHGTSRLIGNMISTRGSAPPPGSAGGSPGARTAQRIIRGDGSVEDIWMQAAGVEVVGDERFEFVGPTGGGFGDALWRPADLVARDVKLAHMSAADAERLYGVVLDGTGAADEGRTEMLRHQRRRERLDRADPPLRSMQGATASPLGGLPLYAGIVQQGDKAVAERSGAVLAEAPDHWTDGCRTLDETDVAPNGFTMETRSYLDPITGECLFHELRRPDGARSFESSPDRWTGRMRGTD
jgi:N-methylhydantoinase B